MAPEIQFLGQQRICVFAANFRISILEKKVVCESGRPLILAFSVFVNNSCVVITKKGKGHSPIWLSGHITNIT